MQLRLVHVLFEKLFELKTVCLSVFIIYLSIKLCVSYYHFRINRDNKNVAMNTITTVSALIPFFRIKRNYETVANKKIKL